MLTETQKQVLSFLANTLLENNIEFQITGGLAAIAYGAKRPLYDIDIDIYKVDVERIREIFQKYIVEDWNNELEGPEDHFDIWMMKLNIDGVLVDISQLEESRVRPAGGEWVSLSAVMKVENHEVEGIQVPVQNKEELIAYKRLVARDTDLEDVRQIH